MHYGARVLAPKQEPANEPGKRGRPRKRYTEERMYGMTLRIPSSIRKALRRLAEYETDERGLVVSIHDLVLECVTGELRARGADL